MSEQLTAAQREAVEHFEGPLLVMAGPGSGKTRVITHRISRLLERGVAADSILALTFTNKAAREMSERVERMLGGVRVRVSTFHRFCSRLLRRWPERVGLKENFTILDQSDQVDLVRRIMKDRDLDTSVLEPGRVLSRISRSRNDMIGSQQFRQQFENRAGGPIDAAVYQIFADYEERVRSQNSVDFDDLLLHTVSLLYDEEEPELRRLLDEKFRFVLVDEYQDTNLAQYRIVQAMSRDYRNLCVTGDPDQSIYGWRGARPANVTAFERDYPDRRVVSLDENFRSTKRIVSCADRLISCNRRPHRGRLTTSNAEGVPVRLLVYEHGEAEADGIAREIRRLVDSGKQRWSDFAVFYRVNALSRLFETTFSRYEVPCQIAAGYSFFERAEVRDLIAWLRLIENDADDSALERIINRPARGIGSASLLKVRRYAALHGLSIFAAARQCASIDGLTARVRKSLEGFVDLIERLQRQSAAGLVGPLLERLIDEIDYLSLWRQEEDEVDVDREANIHELISAARHYDSGAGSLFSGRAMSGDETGTEQESEPLEPPSLQGFLEQATLSSEVDKVDPAKGAVTLMTLHASKGLEYPCVYIAGLENGLIPHERAIRDGDPSSLEEERRLLYVGITRAREHLTLTQTSERVFRGMRRTTISSPFAGEISQELDRGAAQSTPAALALAGMDDRLEAARRRFEAARSSGQRPLLMKGSQLKGEREVPEGDRTDDPSTVPSFRRGMMVRHPRYGTGIVTEVGGASHRATVTVHFEGADDTQTFVASRCPLQPAFPGVSGDGED